MISVYLDLWPVLPGIISLNPMTIVHIRCYYYPYFIEEQDAFGNLVIYPKVSELMNDGARILTQALSPQMLIS